MTNPLCWFKGHDWMTAGPSAFQCRRTICDGYETLGERRHKPHEPVWVRIPRYSPLPKDYDVVCAYCRVPAGEHPK